MKLWSSGCQGKEKDGNAATKSRILSFFDLVIVGLGSSLAVGIFVLIGDLIKNVAGPAVVLSVSIAGLTALVGGLCFSEFGVRFVKVNSAYAYSYSWGRENAAFIFGWILILEYVAGTASAARGIITFIDALADNKITDFLKDIVSTNFRHFFPYFDFFSLGIVVLLTISIVFGLKDYFIIKKIFIIINVVLVVSVVAAGAFKADISNWGIDQSSKEDSIQGFAPFGVLGVVKGAAVAIYGFIGFDRVSVSGNEVRKQKRNLPAAILFTIFATLLAYGGVGVVITLMLPYEKINHYAAVPFAFEDMGWSVAKWVVAVATFFAFQTSLFGAMFPLPRIIHAMANDGLLFPCLGNSHNKIPVVATITGGLTAAAAAGIFTLQRLVNLTVIGALFSYTILAINVILLRYSSKSDDDEMLSSSWTNLINKNADVSVKAVLKNYFNFREKHPTNLTEKIIMGNVVLFCVCSVGLAVVFNFFYDSVAGCTPEAVVPAGIFLAVMFFNLVSMACQPKSQEIIPFKVPLIPLLPCLSIFLNIFLILTFELLTWISFSCWLAVGILPHFAWRLLKCFRGEMGENSLYEINRTNAVKLNESIWKIKTDKKNFYEGAVNPVFSDYLDNRFNEINGDVDIESKAHNDRVALQLKEAEIQTAEVVEEKAQPLASELDLDLIGVGFAETVNELQEENGKVHWECVAEIHTEEEFPQESVALEIVDNTYNFLSEVSEEMSKSIPGGSEKESLSGSENVFKISDGSNSPVSQLSMCKDDASSNKIHASGVRINKISNSDSESQNEYSDSYESLRPTIFNENSKASENTFSENFPKKLNGTNSDFSFGQQKQKELNLMKIVSNTEAQKDETISNYTVNTLAVKSVSDEKKKVKEFKEKLNQLLKNHVNSEKLSTESSLLATETNGIDTNNNNGNNKEALFNSIKTLNKSQIKGKLEILLSKGPPKRATLRDSFNIKLKEPDKENDSEKAQEEIMEIQNGTTYDAEPHVEVSSSALQDSIKQKLLAFKNRRSELPKDVYC